MVRLTPWLLLLAFSMNIAAPSVSGAQRTLRAENSSGAAAEKSAADKADSDDTSKAGADDSKSAKPETIQWAEIKLSGLMPEGPSLPGLFGEISETLNRVFERLDQAAKDKNISAIVLRIENPVIGLGNVHELRTKIQEIRKTGKPVYALLETALTTDYLIASACDKIYMPEPGLLLLTGVRAEVSFYKNLLDMLDVEADILRVGKFKSAAEPYTRTEMSPEFRQEIEELLDDQFSLIVNSIAESRKLEPGAVKQAIDSGPLTPGTALEAKLIDSVLYTDELEQLALADQPQAKFKLVERYGRKKVDTNFDGFSGMMKMMNLLMGVEPGTRRSSTPQIAVIYASGPIMSGRGTSGPFGDDVIGSETMIKAINEAAANDRVKAIVLRVNSPGGSAIASDLIWRALEKVEKPVVVSMGNVAASGGYYISMGADYIYVEPGTITGSIGVVGGKLALTGLFEKLGITTSIVSRGENSGALSMMTRFSETERAAMQKMMQEIYTVFTRKAAAGRKMEHEKLLELAGGRIYTGQRAVENGLVDAIGTLDEAVKKAAELASLKDSSYERLLLPKPTSPLEQLFGPIDADARSVQAVRSVQGQAHLLDTLLPAELSQELKRALLIETLSGSDPRLLIMPYHLQLR